MLFNNRLLRQAGFTLLELMIVLAIVSAVVAASVPSSIRLYQSMVYRSAVADVKAVLESARYQALIKGQVMDVWVQPEARLIGLRRLFDAETIESLPESLMLQVVSAAELQPDNDTAVIRFYPDGSSSGGDVSVIRATGVGVTLHVDWLLGRVSQVILKEP